jgi:hypothetical protein
MAELTMLEPANLLKLAHFTATLVVLVLMIAKPF